MLARANQINLILAVVVVVSLFASMVFSTSSPLHGR